MQKYFVRCGLALSLAALIVASIGCPRGPGKAKWTIIGYIDGNCYLDETPLGSFFIKKVQNMEEVGSTDDVNVIVMVSSKKVGGCAKYYYVEKHLDEPVDCISSMELKDMGTIDMSDGSVLAEFVNYVLEQKEYEAHHYMLILADHGLGWRGVCWDEIQDPQGKACITLPELKSTLSSIGKKFDIIAFDACLMGMCEVAYEIKDFADYMIASQNITWASIDLGYKEWLSSLTAYPDMDAEELAENVANAIYNTGVAANVDVVTATIDLSKMSHLGSTLHTLMSYLLIQTYGAGVQNARNNCYVEPNAPDCVDLKEFVNKVKQEPDVSLVPRIVAAAETLENAIVDAVPFKKGNVQYARNGLSIYFPVSRLYYTATDSANYANLSFTETAWHSFVTAYVQAFGGTQTTTSGTVTWPGHALSSNTYAFLDTSHTEYIIPMVMVYVNPTTGTYNISVYIQTPLETYIEAWDDVNGNQTVDQGDGLGWYDANGNGEWDDMLTINPGQVLTGINITLYNVTGKQKTKKGMKIP